MYYNLRYRGKFAGAALPFGSGVDVGINYLLLNPDKLNEAQEIFVKEFLKELQKIKDNGQITSFSNSDYDESLTDLPKDKGGAQASLIEKGKLFIEAYKEQILPNFKKILSVQHNFNIENDFGDNINGGVDMIVELQDGRVAILDNKTSGSPYKENFDEIEESKLKQLAVYKAALQGQYPIDALGFNVLIKSIRKKKEPRVKTQMIIGDVSDEFIDATFDEYQEVLTGIRMGHFPSNSPNCNSFFGKCICEVYGKSNGEDQSKLVNLKRNYYGQK